MNEKRFKVDLDHLLLVWDTEKNKRLEIKDIVDLLNSFEGDIKHLEEYCGDLEADVKRLQEKLRKNFSDDEIRRLYSDLQRREYEKHCSGETSLTTKLNPEVRY